MRIYSGFIYNFDRKLGEKDRWRCRTRPCRGFLLTSPADMVVEVGEHNHPSDESEADRIVCSSAVKNMALQTREAAANIVTRVTREYDDHAVVALPSRKAMINLVNKVRNTSIPDFVPLLPDFPAGLRTNHRNGVFLRFDSNESEVVPENRFVLFMSEMQEARLKKCGIWCMDGTFKSSPTHFSQLLTIHGEYIGKFYPLCFILLNSKNSKAYKNGLAKLLEILNFSPNSIILDFEKGLKQAVSEVYPDSILYGCNFHYGQMIWRRIQKEGLTVEYKNNSPERKILRRCFHLAYIPQAFILDEFKNIWEKASECSNFKLSSFLTYFNRNFIGMVEDNSDTDSGPAYISEFWSVYSRIRHSIPRTTNIAEAFHRGLNSYSGIAHPNVARFCNLICSIEEDVRVKILRVESGTEFFIPDVNFKKEAILKKIVESWEILDNEAYFKLLDKIIIFSSE